MPKIPLNPYRKTQRKNIICFSRHGKHNNSKIIDTSFSVYAIPAVFIRSQILAYQFFALLFVYSQSSVDGLLKFPVCDAKKTDLLAGVASATRRVRNGVLGFVPLLIGLKRLQRPSKAKGDMTVVVTVHPGREVSKEEWQRCRVSFHVVTVRVYFLMLIPLHHHFLLLVSFQFFRLRILLLSILSMSFNQHWS